MNRWLGAVCGLMLVLVAPALAAPNPGGGAPPGGGKSSSAATISAAPNLLTFGSSTAITGQVTGKKSAGAAVTLEGKPAPFTTAFAAVATTTADATGHYAFKVTPRLNTVYRVIAKSAPTATSPDALVKVRVKITLRSSTTFPTAGQAVRFSGFAAPAYTGRLVQIQRKAGTGWKTVARAMLSAATSSGGATRSQYSKRVRISKSGVYRVFFNPADGLRLANTSPSRKLTVR